MRRRGFSRLVVAATAALVLSGAVAAGAVFASVRDAKARPQRIGARHLVQIKVLSTRPDLVSAGEALTQIVLPPGVRPASVRLELGTRNVGRQFAVRANGKFEGLVTGLRLGANLLTARLPSGYGARLTIVNHPIGGPVFSGPQIQPWLCQAGAKDKQCDQPPTFAYYYLPAGTGNTGAGASGIASDSPFQSYDPSNPPASSAIATTTTTDGVTVPFIVREETGYIDRDQYAIASAVAAGQAVAALGAAAAVQRPPCDHPRRELRHDLRDRHRPDGDGREDPRRRLHRHVDGARQRGPQLQPPDRGRVAGDDEGVGHRPLRRGQVDDRQRLLGRLAGPAAGGQRLSGPLPGDHSAMQLHRCVVVGDGVRGLLHAAELLRRTGTARTPGDRRRSAP